MDVELISTVTCPECGAQHEHEMPTDACVQVLECPACQARLKRQEGDCCVFCSYGDVACPPIQQDQGC